MFEGVSLIVHVALGRPFTQLGVSFKIVLYMHSNMICLPLDKRTLYTLQHSLLQTVLSLSRRLFESFAN